MSTQNLLIGTCPYCQKQTDFIPIPTMKSQFGGAMYRCKKCKKLLALDPVSPK